MSKLFGRRLLLAEAVGGPRHSVSDFGPNAEAQGIGLPEWGKCLVAQLNKRRFGAVKN